MEVQFNDSLKKKTLWFTSFSYRFLLCFFFSRISFLEIYILFNKYHKMFALFSKGSLFFLRSPSSKNNHKLSPYILYICIYILFYTIEQATQMSCNIEYFSYTFFYYISIQYEYL